MYYVLDTMIKLGICGEFTRQFRYMSCVHHRSLGVLSRTPHWLQES